MSCTQSGAVLTVPLESSREASDSPSPGANSSDLPFTPLFSELVGNKPLAGGWPAPSSTHAGDQAQGRGGQAPPHLTVPGAVR